MKQIAIISFDPEADVTEGLSELIEKNPGLTVLLPILEYGEFARSALQVVFETKVDIHLFFSETAHINEVVNADDITFCVDPNREIMRHIQPEDVLGIVWDDSTEAHIALHALEDYGLEVWSITDGLDVIEIDYDDSDNIQQVKADMLDNLDRFLDSMLEYVTMSVLDVLAETIADRIQEEDGKRDIDPFKDKNP
jgi:hypothetical protein